MSGRTRAGIGWSLRNEGRGDGSWARSGQCNTVQHFDLDGEGKKSKVEG